ncbi:two-component sensor histidine kinase [Actinomadura craniellae]|uniref:histidine kinase n=1 Tax=Actinomadura craniellae TaxID=2231787 RepID=A0A365H677_9ACTN|nr:histidine kinase [Actinomadura craniellae]RAY14587.1 two-component sensor histidine kinase [Actinomadura craniellae]
MDRSWMRRIRADLAPGAGTPLLPTRLGWLPHALAGLYGVFLAGFSWHTLIEDFGVPNPLAGALSVAQALALPLCLYWPMSGWWLSLAVGMAISLAGGTLWPGPAFAVHLNVLALAGARVRPRVLVEMWVLTLATGFGVAFVVPGREAIVTMPLLAGAVLAVVGALRGRSEALRRLARAERLRGEERDRLVLLEERARIARELHDVVAHHMSVIAVQAEAAPYRVADPPPELVRGFETIRGGALAAMTELHRVLGLLRDESGTAEPVPQPTLDHLPELVTGVREAGLPVALAVSGDPRPLPPGVALSAYRIVQEALSNVLRHAPGAEVRVEIDHLGDRLELRVANGPSPAGAPGSPPGHGLLGMRERAAMLGGSLRTGPLPDGGYEVAAVLPGAGEEAP